MIAYIFSSPTNVLKIPDVVGTSASVYPAAELPQTAKRNGAFIIECNIEPTEFTDSITDVFLQGPAGQTLAALAAAVVDPAQ